MASPAPSTLSPQEGVLRGGPPPIPGATNLPRALAVRYGGTFRAAEQLRQVSEGAGVTPGCSRHTWFVLTELPGHPNVMNDDGSWTEWRTAASVPTEKE